MATAAVDTRPRVFETALSPDVSPYYFQDGFESGVRKKMAHGGMEKVPWIDTIIETVNGEETSRVIRHIASCKSIYQDEQIKMGYSLDYRLSRVGNNRGSRADIIYIMNGQIQVDKKTQKSTLEYLDKCNYNGSNPNRNPEKKILFYTKDIVQIAKKALSNRTKADKAHYLINQLEGDRRKLTDLARLFTIDHMGDEAEIIMSLHGRADVDPDSIIVAITDDKTTAAIVASKCEELGIIHFTGNGYKYHTGDLIKGFAGKQKQDVAFKALVAFLQSDDGQAHYENMQAQLNARAKSEAEDSVS